MLLQSNARTREGMRVKEKRSRGEEQGVRPWEEGSKAEARLWMPSGEINESSAAHVEIHHPINTRAVCEPAIDDRRNDTNAIPEQAQAQVLTHRRTQTRERKGQRHGPENEEDQQNKEGSCAWTRRRMPYALSWPLPFLPSLRGFLPPSLYSSTSNTTS